MWLFGLGIHGGTAKVLDMFGVGSFVVGCWWGFLSLFIFPISYFPLLSCFFLFRFFLFFLDASGLVGRVICILDIVAWGTPAVLDV